MGIRKDWDSPLATGVRVATASSAVFANRKTAVVSLIVLPLLQLLLYVAIAASAGSSQVTFSAYASVLVSACTTVASGLVASVSRDRQLGVLLDALFGRTFSFSYWTGKAITPALTSGIVSVVMICGIFILDSAHQLRMLFGALFLLVISLIVGAIFGLAIATMSIGLKDPFMISNIVVLVLPVTSGVMAPITLYPQWLEMISRLFPMTATLSAFRTFFDQMRGAGEGGLGASAGVAWTHVWVELGIELVVVAVWFSVGLALTRLVLRQIRAGKRSEDIW